MEKARKKTDKKPIDKRGVFYSTKIKHKIVGEMKSRFHSNRTEAKLYDISRNSINNWVIQDSLIPWNSNIYDTPYLLDNFLLN